MTTGAASGAASSGFASEIAEGSRVSSAAGAAGEAGGTSADGAVTAGFWGAGEASALAGVVSGASAANASSVVAGMALGASGARGVPEAAGAASGSGGAAALAEMAVGTSATGGSSPAAGKALRASDTRSLVGAASGSGGAVALAEADAAPSDSSVAAGKLRPPVLPADSATTDLLGTAGISALLKRSSQEIFPAAETQASAPTSVPEARPARSWEVLVPWSALEALAKERTPVAAMSAGSPRSMFSLGENESRTRPNSLDAAFEPWTPASSGGAAEARSPAALRSQARPAESGRELRPAGTASSADSRVSSGPDSPTPLTPASRPGSPAPRHSGQVRSSAERDSPPQPESEPSTHLRSLAPADSRPEPSPGPPTRLRPETPPAPSPESPLTPPSQLRPETPPVSLTEPDQETQPGSPSAPPAQLHPANPSKLRPPTRIHPDPSAPADPAHPLAKLTALPGVSTASTVAAERASRTDWDQAAGRMLPVAPALADLLPGAGLRRGSVVAVHHSTSLLFALLAEATVAGAWAAVVGAPSLGIVAAAEHGVAVSRLALVPQPGAEYQAVMAALLDGVDLVVTEPRSVRPDVARRLAARARHRGAVLLSLGHWPSADVELHCTPGAWTGVLEHGAGHLRSRPVEVHARGRGAAARPRSASMLLPGQDGRVSQGEKRVAAREEAVG